MNPWWSPYLVAFIINKLSKFIQQDMFLCMIFVNDMVLTDETLVGVNRKLRVMDEGTEA